MIPWLKEYRVGVSVERPCSSSRGVVDDMNGDGDGFEVQDRNGLREDNR